MASCANKFVQFTNSYIQIVTFFCFCNSFYYYLSCVPLLCFLVGLIGAEELAGRADALGPGGKDRSSDVV